MNGAESLVTTLADQGVEICFANPGTSEMHFLAALDSPRMKFLTGLRTMSTRQDTSKTVASGSSAVREAQQVFDLSSSGFPFGSARCAREGGPFFIRDACRVHGAIVSRRGRV